MQVKLELTEGAPPESIPDDTYEQFTLLLVNGHVYGATAVKPNGDVFFVPYIRPHADPAGRWGNPVFLGNHPITNWHYSQIGV